MRLEKNRRCEIMKSGFIGVIGKANAGKSTLINVLVGEKVAIVSPKPQTTRDAILGILTKEDYQIVFVDTPGIYKSKNKLTDVDFILFVHDGHGGISDSDISLIKRYADSDIPMAIAYTKIDIMPKENIPADIKLLYENGIDCDVFPVSARKRTNIYDFGNNARKNSFEIFRRNSARRCNFRKRIQETGKRRLRYQSRYCLRKAES